MILIDASEIDRWSPNFSSSGQKNPDWIRLMFGNVVLCNSLESAEWDQNPVQVEICPQCGIAQCATGGYIHASRMGDHIFWTRPRMIDEETWSDEEYAPANAIRTFGAVAIPVTTWEKWRSRYSLYASEVFPATTGDVLADVWLSGIPRSLDCRTVDDVLPMLQRNLLAADTMEIEMAVAKVSQLLDLFKRYAGEPIEGSVQSVKTQAAVAEKLYLDGTRCEEWTAFALRDGIALPLLSPELVVAFDALR